MSLVPVLVLAAAASAPAGPVSEPPAAFAVLELQPARDPDLGPAAASLAATLRGEIAGMDPEGVRRRLGLPLAPPERIRERLDAAELYSFQLDVPAARTEIEAALAELRGATGEEARAQVRAARLLLATVLLPAGGTDGSEAAQEALRRLASAETTFTPDPRQYPPEVLRAYADARSRVEPGTLRVDCGGCTGAQVFVDGAAAGAPGEALHVGAGLHDVVVASPAARSRTLSVEVPPGKEVAASLEPALSPQGALLFAGDEAGARAAVARAASWLGAPVIAAWSSHEGGRRLHAAVAQPGQAARVVETTVDADGEEAAARRLAHLALAPQASMPAAALAAPGPGALSGGEAGAKQQEVRALRAARWASGALAVALGAAGTYLVFDANHRQDDLGRQVDAQIAASGRIADRHGAAVQIQSIEDQKRLGGVLLAGGAVLAAGTVALLLAGGGDAGVQAGAGGARVSF